MKYVGMCGLCGCLVPDSHAHTPIYVETKEGREVLLCERCLYVYNEILDREEKVPILEGY